MVHYISKVFLEADNGVSHILTMLALFFFASVALANRGPFIGAVNNKKRGMDLIPTPHGMRPSKRVIRHDSYDVYLDYNETGTLAHHRDTGKSRFFPADPDCIENAKDLVFASNLKAWDVDASYTPSNMGTFNATYKIPNQVSYLYLNI